MKHFKSSPKMKVTEHIAKAKGKTLLSFEVLPPLKGKSIQSIFKVLDPLMEFNPPFINVTYHRSEYMYKMQNDNSFRKVVVRKRPGTVGICAAIMNKYGVDAVPHIICGGFNQDDTEDALIDLNFLGINNVLVIRGDAMKSESTFVPEPNGHAYASELVQQIGNMNKGIYLAEELRNADPTDFCVGVAGYPEKHYEAPNMKADLKYLKKKIELGADYIVTQMFFDNQKYFDFVKLCRAEGITVPIIPGLKPISTKRHLSLIPRIFKVDLPEDLAEAVEGAKDKEAVIQIGREWCLQQSKELKEAGVPVIHYYTMGRTSTFIKIAKEVV